MRLWRIVFPLGFLLAALVLPAAAQSPAPPANPLAIMAEGLADALERLAAAEKRLDGAATKKELAAVGTQQQANDRRLATAIYKLAGLPDAVASGRAFGNSPKRQEGSLYAAADGHASFMRSLNAREELARAATPTQPAPAQAQPAPATPQPGPVTGVPGTVPSVPAPPAPPSTKTRDQRVADMLEQALAQFAGVVRELRQPQ